MFSGFCSVSAFKFSMIQGYFIKYWHKKMRNKVVVSLDSHKVGPSASQISVIVYFNKTVYGDRALQVTGQLNADF